MSDLQRERIAAAADVFERVLQGFEEAPPVTGDAGRPRTERVQLAQLRTAAARTIDLYGQLLQEAMEAVVHLVDDLVPGLGAGAEPPLALAGRRGAIVSAPVWVHNSTEAAVRGVELRLTDLTAPGGAELPGSVATFLPDRIDVAPQASGESRLHVAIPADAVPGTYHGHMLAGALPAAALAIRVEVKG